MEISNVQIARLVLGYLKSEKCSSAYTEFLKTSQLLKDQLGLIKNNKYFATRVGGLCLEDFLRAYAQISTMVQGRLEATNYYQENHANTTLLDQLNYLLDKNGRSRTSTPILSCHPSPQFEDHQEEEIEIVDDDSDHNKEVSTTSPESLPGNVCDEPISTKRNTVSSSLKTRTPHKSRTVSTEENLDVSQLLAQTLLPNAGKIAEAINSYRESPTDNQKSQPKTGGDELEAEIKAITQKTDGNPHYLSKLDELVQDCLKIIEDTPENPTSEVDPVPATNPTEPQQSVSSSSSQLQNPPQSNFTTSDVIIFDADFLKNTSIINTPAQNQYVGNIRMFPTVSTMYPIINLTSQDIMKMPTVILNEEPKVSKNVPILPNISSLDASSGVSEYLTLYSANTTNSQDVEIINKPIAPKTSRRKAMASAKKYKSKLRSCKTKESPKPKSAAKPANKRKSTSPVKAASGSKPKTTTKKAEPKTNEKPAATTSGAKTNDKKQITPLEKTKNTTPKSGSHVRNLDFSTPLKTYSPSSRKSTSRTENKDIDENSVMKNIFEETTKKKAWDAELRAYSAANVSNSPPIKRSKRTKPSKNSSKQQEAEEVELAGQKLEDALKTPLKKNEDSKAVVEVTSTSTRDSEEIIQIEDSDTNKEEPCALTVSYIEKNSEDLSSIAYSLRNCNAPLRSKRKCNINNKPKETPEPKVVTEKEDNQCIILSPSKLNLNANKRNLVLNQEIIGKNMLCLDETEEIMELEDDLAENVDNPAPPEQAVQKSPESTFRKLEDNLIFVVQSEEEKMNSEKERLELGETLLKLSETTSHIEEKHNSTEATNSTELKTDVTGNEPTTSLKESGSQPEKENIIYQTSKTIDISVECTTAEEEITEQSFVASDKMPKRGIVLETPIKSSYPIPKTPGVVTPGFGFTPFAKVLEDQLQGVDLSSLDTPKMPLTPNFPITPCVDLLSPYPNRPTDYSTSSSYYQPSDNEQNKSVEQMLIEESKRLNSVKVSPPKQTEIKILSNVLIEQKVEVTKPNVPSDLGAMKKVFNACVIGKKNLNLVKRQPTTLTSSSSSSSDSDSSEELEKNVTAIFKSKVETPYSLRKRYTCDDDIKSILNTLDSSDNKNKTSLSNTNSVLKEIETKRRRTISSLKNIKVTPQRTTRVRNTKAAVNKKSESKKTPKRNVRRSLEKVEDPQENSKTDEEFTLHLSTDEELETKLHSLQNQNNKEEHLSEEIDSISKSGNSLKVQIKHISDTKSNNSGHETLQLIKEELANNKGIKTAKNDKATNKKSDIDNKPKKSLKNEKPLVNTDKTTKNDKNTHKNASKNNQSTPKSDNRSKKVDDKKSDQKHVTSPISKKTHETVQSKKISTSKSKSPGKASNSRKQTTNAVRDSKNCKKIDFEESKAPENKKLEPQDLESDSEAKKLVEDLRERGIHLMHNKAPKTINLSAHIHHELDEKERSYTEDKVFDFKTFETPDLQISFKSSQKTKSIKDYDFTLCNKEINAEVYVEFFDADMERTMKWTHVESLLEVPSHSTGAVKKVRERRMSKSPVKNVKVELNIRSPLHELEDGEVVDDEELMNYAVVGSVREENEEVEYYSPKSTKKRKGDFAEESSRSEKRSKTENCVELLKNVDVDKFLNQVHGSSS